jgi:predicted enzyme related to lactoylglutathione lyase
MAGEVVHVEFPSTDVDRAQRFWSEVFGWSFGESAMPGMDYRMARVNDNAGVALMAGETGHPTFYFDTTDIDASIAKVRELGGKAEDKSPVPTHGWFAACTDSEGNVFSLWQSDPAAG